MSMLIRHSHEWRTKDRPALEKMLAEAAEECMQMAREFETFMNQRNRGRYGEKSDV
ncbi:hypothetical protein [Paraburkholderia sp. 40]|uniref:hypothetical protein n=1 Tax=Paraburkholderia sp. 40 TaxID=2991059 RepID=UPI003D1CB8B5